MQQDRESPPAAPRESASGATYGDDSPLMTLVSAAIFLYVGFWMGLTPLSDAPLAYKFSVWGFTWMGRIAGIALLVVAGLGFARVGGGALAWLDAAVSVLACAGCLLCGAVWLAYGDMQGVLLVALGLLNGSAARHGLARLRRGHGGGA